jgi:hypothetical protein
MRPSVRLEPTEQKQESSAPTLLRLQQISKSFLEPFLLYLLMGEWSFLTNHARVLVCIARDPGVRLREIASVAVGQSSSAIEDAARLAAPGSGGR